MINFIKVVQPRNIIYYKNLDNECYIILYSGFYPYNYDCYSYHHRYNIFECKSKEFVINYLLNLKFSKIEYTLKFLWLEYNDNVTNKIIIFDISIYTNFWKQFVKKKKKQRLILKLLKATAEHLGNPRFIDFKI